MQGEKLHNFFFRSLYMKIHFLLLKRLETLVYGLNAISVFKICSKHLSGLLCSNQGLKLLKQYLTQAAALMAVSALVGSQLD